MKSYISTMGKLSFCLYFMCLLLFTACSNKEKPLVIGVSQCSEDVWRDKLNNELLMASYQYNNVELKIVSANDDDQMQRQQIRDLVSSGIDLLIVSPNQLHTITSTIDSVYDRGIPVVLFDRKTDSEKYTAFIGADNFEAGRAMGQYIADQMGGTGQLLEIAGLEGSSPAAERHRGFMSAIEKYPDIEFLGQRYAGWTQSEAARQMDCALKDGRVPAFVFAQNDRMALGAKQAAEKRGYKGIRYVGIDALPVKGAGLEKVAQGELEASYIYPTRGDLVMQLAINILQKKQYKRENYVRGALVTDEHARLLLMQHEEVDKQQSRLTGLHQQVDEYLSQYNTQKILLLLLGVIIVLLIGLVTYIYYTTLQRRRLEAESTQAKLQFFTNISHELRTPLTLISTPIRHLLDDSNPTREQRDLLEMARRNVEILTQLVNEILDFRKLQNGKAELNAAPLNLTQELNDWAAPFAATAGEKNIKVELQIDDTLTVMADRKKLRRVCYNLLSNALKYTPASGTIGLTAHRIGDDVVISVSNTGKTIPEDAQIHLFDRFYQTPGTEGGTGIGLALVKAYTELHGGTAAVTSTDGLTVFTCRMPLPQTSIDQPTSTEAVLSPIPLERSGDVASSLEKHQRAQQLINDNTHELPRLLVVDDNADMRAIIAAGLAGQYHILSAADGAEGLRMARLEIPDIIVSDVMMPVMDGLELTRQLKADPLTCHIPVILLTARTQESHRADGYDVGADGYLTKPFSEDVLRSRVRNLLQNRRLLKNIFNTEQSTSGGKSLVKKEETQPAHSAENIFIDKFREIVQANISDSDFNIDSLCQELAISRAQLYRKVKALTGQAPLDLIREARLQRAKRLLETTDKSVSEIAYDTGFSSPSYFTKCYREFFGTTPGTRGK